MKDSVASYKRQSTACNGAKEMLSICEQPASGFAPVAPCKVTRLIRNATSIMDSNQCKQHMHGSMLAYRCLCAFRSCLKDRSIRNVRAFKCIYKLFPHSAHT
eukprot:166360-Pelagomonas_calceolata.AAC.2